MSEERDFILRNFHDDDSLERAQSAFGSCTPQELQQKYGQSDRTRQEILDLYRAQRERYNKAIAWLKAQP